MVSGWVTTWCLLLKTKCKVLQNGHVWAEEFVGRLRLDGRDSPILRFGLLCGVVRMTMAYSLNIYLCFSRLEHKKNTARNQQVRCLFGR